ncbi:N-acetylgalactosamine kinase [Cyclospora cayetanensis]|uniref:N-acetylgalactosamine kinase n=1 Tax=Cyclospora cayetanensis TaxID=88456 RepID=A0A1D3CSC6_9EIME|nr:N-acetylgalactosamine kinase [Cyclospora cayetanensis]
MFVFPHVLVLCSVLGAFPFPMSCSLHLFVSLCFHSSMLNYSSLCFAHCSRSAVRISACLPRVCLIGEHIDYSGYSVVTAAIERFCCCAISCKQLSEASPQVTSRTSTNADNTALESVHTNESSTEAAEGLAPLTGVAETSIGVNRVVAPESCHTDGEPNDQRVIEEKVATLEDFLTVKHQDDDNFAPLCVQTLDSLFVTLENSVRAGDEATNSSAQAIRNSILTRMHVWHSYVIAGCLGALEFINSQDSTSVGRLTSCSWVDFAGEIKTKVPAVSIKVAVSGDLPLGAGLSSSSALVIAVTAAVSAALGSEISHRELAEVCMRAERYVGVQGGGMDHASICLASSGFASLISFHPLSVELLKLPENCSLALGYCGTDAKKVEGSHKKYNLRVLECKLAALLLMGAKPSSSSPVESLERIDLSYVQSTFLGTLQDAVAAVERTFHEEPYTKEELESILGDLLGKRARHVFMEAIRVRQFADACNGLGSEEDKLQTIGTLANASHASLRDDFQCSTDQLDAYVSSALASGAVGSRLTGAGWGGFTVSFLRKGDEEQFKQKA